MFVGICTTQGSPTLDEVKDHCFDLIAAVSIDMPQITHQIKTAETMKELADVVCFRLSRWLSYDFFKKVVTYFQPALKSVKERLMDYEDQLKPLLLQKLEYIAKLQLRWVMETTDTKMSAYFLHCVLLHVYLYVMCVVVCTPHYTGYCA